MKVTIKIYDDIDIFTGRIKAVSDAFVNM